MSKSAAPPVAPLTLDSGLKDQSGVRQKGSIEPAFRSPYLNENDRQRRLQRMHNLMVDGLCWPMEDVRKVLAPRDGPPPRVLDVGCRCGTWTIEFAREFPDAEVLGIDMAVATPSNMPQNCRFEALDLFEGDLSHLEGKFDVVRCARAAGWVRYYKPHLKRVMGFLKPGGILLHEVGDIEVYDENKIAMKPAQSLEDTGTASWFARFWIEARSHLGLFSDMPSPGFLEGIKSFIEEDPRMENVVFKDVYPPTGWPGREEDNLPNREELGRVWRVNSIERLRSLREPLVESNMPQELVDLCIQEAIADTEEVRVRAYGRWQFLAAYRKSV